MFQQPSVFQTKQIDEGIAVFAEQTCPMDMKNNEVIIGKDAFDFAFRVGTSVLPSFSRTST